jgi:hypothetical protein
MNNKYNISNEIRFRGKTNEGRWIYGLPSYDCWGDITQIAVYNSKKPWLTKSIFIDPDTLSEYTRFQDKSEKEVFGGDIMEFYFDDLHPEEATYGTVEWQDECLRLFEHNCSYGDEFYRSDAAKGRIVGNVWDTNIDDLVKTNSEKTICQILKKEGDAND